MWRTKSGLYTAGLRPGPQAIPGGCPALVALQQSSMCRSLVMQPLNEVGQMVYLAGCSGEVEKHDSDKGMQYAQHLMLRFAGTHGLATLPSELLAIDNTYNCSVALLMICSPHERFEAPSRGLMLTG